MKSLESIINDCKIRISLLEEQQKNAGDNSALQNQITDLQNQITNNIEKIQDLENQLQNVGEAGQKNVGTSVAEISALMNDYVTENDFCTAASEKLQFGAQCKVEYAPHARIFFRHNPLKTLAPTITLGFWLSPLPSGITNLPATITLNGTTIFTGNLEITATSGEVAKITLPINRTECPMQVFNVLEVSFNDDTNFASTFLDWIEVEITQSQNCIILNRSTDHEIYGVKRTSGVHRIYDTRYQGAGVYKWVGGDSIDISKEDIIYNDFKATPPDNIPFKFNALYLQHQYNLNNQSEYTFLISYNFEYKITQNNTFHAYSTFFNATDTKAYNYCVENVLYAKPSAHNSNELIQNTCCVLQDFSLGIYRASLHTSYYNNFLEKFDFLLGGESYPSEFIDFIPIKDYFIGFRTGFQNAGYFLLHQSGNILFIPSMHSIYFLTIDKGRQVNAFLGEDGNSIILTYQKNKTIIKKILKRNDAKGTWNVAGGSENFTDIQELHFCADQSFVIKNNKVVKFEA